MRVELTQKVSFTDALGNPSTDEPGSQLACCHSQLSEVGPLYSLQAGGQSGNKDPKALFKEPYDKGDFEFAVEHRAHVGKGYMVDIKVWTWVQDMGIPPYGNSKEAINDVNSTGSFRYTMSCQTVDTLDEDMMKAFKPDFTGAREDVQRLIPHTVMLEIEGKISNENEDKATVNRNWSAEDGMGQKPTGQEEQKVHGDRQTPCYPPDPLWSSLRVPMDHVSPCSRRGPERAGPP